MTDTRRAVFALGTVVCLIVVASALPAADPRLDPPGSQGEDVVAGEWDSGDERSDIPTESTNQSTSTEQADSEADDEEQIDILDSPVPGTQMTVKTESSGSTRTDNVTVDGEVVGETSRHGKVEVEVPFEESMTISVEGKDVNRTVDIETDATIHKRSAAAPARNLSITAAVATEPLVGTPVRVDDEVVTWTDDDGDAAVPLPNSPGPVEISVVRRAVRAERTVSVTEPTVDFATPVLFPGFPAPVVVSADGEPIENATVQIGGSVAGTTDRSGRTTVWLPIEDSATVTATVGAASATATVGNLYFRLAAVVVVVPGLIIGGVLTYLKLVALRKRRRAKGFVKVFVGFGTVLAGLSGSAGRLWGLLGNWRPSVPVISRPSLSGFGEGWQFPAVGATFTAASLGGITATLSSFGSLRRVVSGSPDRTGTERSPSSRIVEWLSDDETNTVDDDADEATAGTDEPPPSLTPREEIRAAWHSFLDRLDIRRRETVTPGTVARRAIRAGFPVDSVRRLLGIVRAVEYGGREPSPERVTSARALAEELIAFETEQGDDQPRADGDSDEGSDE